MQSKFIKRLAAGAIVWSGLVGGAQAQTYGFDCVTNNSAANCGTGESQFSLTLTQGVGFVDFLIRNIGSASSLITDIYFDWLNDAATFSQGQIINGAGVGYSWGASPSNLPGGRNLNPDFTANLGADSNAPTSHNGVNPNEQVTFRFLTSATGTASDLDSGALRLGLHAQAFANGGSESFVSVGRPTVVGPVPEPETYLMMMAGLAMLGATIRRRNRKS